MTTETNDQTPDPRLISTGAQLDAWQQRLGWSANRCAKELDITPGYYSKLINDKAPAGISKRIALSCIALEELYGNGKGEAGPKVSPPAAASSR